MNKIYADACCEVDYILTHIDSRDIEKIPKKLRDFFKDKKSKYYEIKITPEIPLIKQELLDETKAIISFLNRKYLCNEEEKRVREKTFIEELKKERSKTKPYKEGIQKESEVNCDIVHMNTIQTEVELPCVYEKKSGLEKIIENIKYLFKKLIKRK